jgi:hypothetical protein
MSRRRREMQRELSANILQCQPNSVNVGDWPILFG